MNRQSRKAQQDRAVAYVVLMFVFVPFLVFSIAHLITLWSR